MERETRSMPWMCLATACAEFMPKTVCFLPIHATWVKKFLSVKEGSTFPLSLNQKLSLRIWSLKPTVRSSFCQLSGGIDDCNTLGPESDFIDTTGAGGSA